jgi:hypothetical protein
VTVKRKWRHAAEHVVRRLGLYAQSEPMRFGLIIDAWA